MESKTYNDISHSTEILKKFHKNINNLKIQIDPSKWKPVVFEETSEDELSTTKYTGWDRDLIGANTYGATGENDERCKENQFVEEIKSAKGEDSESKLNDNIKVPISMITNAHGNDKTLRKSDFSSENNFRNTSMAENDIDLSGVKVERNQDKKKCLAIERRWVVLFAGLVLIFMSTGITFQLSIMYIELLDEFETSNAETSLVQAVTMGVFFGGGFISGMIVAKCGVQVAGTIAGIISATGLSISFFATNIYHLVVTVGCIAGLGFSIAYICSSTCVGQYFMGKGKLVALSFIAFGSGVGSMVFPYIMTYLIQVYGWRGTLLIIGGMTLNFIPAALLCVPVNESSATKNIKKETSFQLSALQKERQNEECKEGEFPKHVRKRKNKGLRTVLKNKIFLLYAVAMAMTISALNSLLIFFIDFFQSRGLDISTSVFVLFICNTVGTSIRFLPGLIKQIPHTSVLVIPAIHATIGCVAASMFPLATTYGQLLLVSCCYGISLGGIVTTLSVATVKLVGIENYSTGLGFLLSICSVGVVSAGPITGTIRDITGSYDVSFYTASSALGFASVMFIIITLWRMRTRTYEGAEIMEIIVHRRMSRKRSSILPWK